MTLQPPDKQVNGRSYSSPRRAQQAEETRRAILEAALQLFTQQGFHQTSVKQVAKAAGVSEQTVYNVFTDKVGLLWNAGMMFIGADGSPDDAALLDALQTEPDPMERVRIVARSSRVFWAESADAIFQLERLTFDPQATDPRLVELAERSLAWRRSNTRAVCELVFPDGIRRAGLNLDLVVDYLTAVESAATVITLRNLGWDMDHWEAWVVQMLSLFIDPGVVGAPDAGEADSG